MAYPIEFTEQNAVLGSGNNPGTENLPIANCTVAVNSENPDVPFIVSCWQLSPEEIAEVQKTGRVYLGVMGKTTYPVSVIGVNPFTTGYYKLKS